ncbi:MAG: FAD-binding oxidoreductase [Gammaproteobacteria bacterium]|nr:FAD-binding oxidoreductase [Gammaproteobacteria bacterium]MDH5240383.1 FAD-binding oxidoreductase [Gammaproteobacteria bacterium]MDH5261609.1 FAD-binding oxidoreductase [Gammaproteobacteria bacterium]MDH5584080.1 FAD-binding oxidoreductase [Gammaproteobacteria bacterium]
MDRRIFCRTAIAAGIAASHPLLGACSRSEPPVATSANTSIRGISLDGAEIELERAALKELGDAMTGPVMLSGHPDYDGARAIWNGMHDKRPALIARCLNNDDVSRAVTFAAERDLLVAVRGGGHSWPGKSVCDDGMMIDLSQLTDVTVDTATQRATAGGGALLGHLDQATLPHGLVTTTGVVSHTGVGGFTLGGGFGRLNRKFGLAVDNLRAATIITADGKIRTVSADEDPDLFWALRGGGGNFGVVTHFDFQLHPFNRNVLSGSIVWPFDQARDVLEFYAEWSAGLSDEMYAGPTTLTSPDGDRLIMVDIVYNGDPAEGEKELAPLRAIGKPIADGVVAQDYSVLQTNLDVPFGHGIRSYAKNGMVKAWSQGLVDTMLEADDPRVFVGNHVAGAAVKRVGELDTAFPHRNAEIMIVIASGWMDAAQDEELIAACRAYYSALEPHLGGYYTNIDFDGSEAAGNYGPAYNRLSAIKGQHDPRNLFRLNSNIVPT